MEIKEFENLVGERAEIKTEIARLKRDVIGPMQARMDEIDEVLVTQLEDMEINSFKTKHGSVSKSVRTTFKTPKTREDKELFFDWLKESRGEEAFWEKVNIPSVTLNSIVKEEFDVALDEGNLGFEIPGLEDPTMRTIISMRKS